MSKFTLLVDRVLGTFYSLFIVAIFVFLKVADSLSKTGKRR